MSPLLDDDVDLQRSRNDRELTLSTGAILGIFFGLVLVCALFFVFGYNMGRRSTPVAAGTAADSPYENSASANAAYSSSKPSPGSLNSDSAAAVATGTPVSTSVTGSTTRNASTPSSGDASTYTQPKPVPAAVPKPETPALAAVERPLAPVPAASYGPGNFVVQVAAVSHQEDADLLVNALQRKGYSVSARSETGDKLVHIQVGPFSDHKAADAMRQRLISDGYNAIIKQY